MSRRPGRIVADVPVPFASPRTAELRSQADYARLCGEVTARLREGWNMKPLARWLAQVGLPPVVFFVIVLGAWQAATSLWEIPVYLVPGPERVWESAQENGELLRKAIPLTGSAALTGFGLSLLVGTILGLLFSQSRIVQRSVYPYAIFLQTVPIVAIAPVLIVWFGNGFWGVVSVAFILSLFPIVTNATAGLTAVDTTLLELFEVNNASRWQTLLKLRLPGAIPSLVTGAKISCGLSVIGAIVGEISAGFGTGTPWPGHDDHHGHGQARHGIGLCRGDLFDAAFHRDICYGELPGSHDPGSLAHVWPSVQHDRRLTAPNELLAHDIQPFGHRLPIQRD